MTVSDAPAPSEHPRREMSEDEKLIAQWEARHDVAARGHHPDPMAVQHYLEHTRTAERGRHDRPVTPPAGRPARPAASEQPRRPWWRRLFRRS
ncbi:hypothetical protein ACWKWC_08510 [Geodermatophilus nigrescens]|uniref:hypothetical protein n=1 Tax=Geodermatophilus sp. FMUSA9-8 TaxID=3120155 RepID=UPI00300AFBA9